MSGNTLATTELDRAVDFAAECSFLQLAETAESLNFSEPEARSHWSGTLREEPLDETAGAGGKVLSGAVLLPTVALIQGVFYLVAGLWPIIDIDSFQAVTGPKTDLWLVRTVSVLIIVVGSVLVSAARRRRLTDEVVLLGLGSALALAAIDLIYALSGIISEVYLADAAAEITLAAFWVIGRLRSQRT